MRGVRGRMPARAPLEVVLELGGRGRRHRGGAAEREDARDGEEGEEDACGVHVYDRLRRWCMSLAVGGTRLWCERVKRWEWTTRGTSGGGNGGTDAGATHTLRKTPTGLLICVTWVG